MYVVAGSVGQCVLLLDQWVSERERVCVCVWLQGLKVCICVVAGSLHQSVVVAGSVPQCGVVSGLIPQCLCFVAGSTP